MKVSSFFFFQVDEPHISRKEKRYNIRQNLQTCSITNKTNLLDMEKKNQTQINQKQPAANTTSMFFFKKKFNYFFKN